MKDKKDYSLLENIQDADNYFQSQIKNKEIQIKILKAEVEQLYEFINTIQHIGELESQRLEAVKNES